MKSSPRKKTGPKHIVVTERWLKSHPLPKVDGDADKESRGQTLIIAGSRSTPGAAVLAATAALRAGAGKLKIATPESVAQAIAMVVIESRVLSLPEEKDESLARGAMKILAESIASANGILIGPGMTGEDSLCRLIAQVFDELTEAAILLDAEALKFFRPHTVLPSNLRGRVVITPHAGEMAAILDVDKKEIEASPEKMAAEYARQSGCIVILKGAETFIASPAAELFKHVGGNGGLAVSGSGDTLAGIIVGLLARGTPPVSAAIWGVHLHAKAGERLAKRIGPVGYLPRELLLEIPQVMSGKRG